MTTTRRTFLKGLAGLPLPMLVGGRLIDDAGRIETAEERAIIVPDSRLVSAAEVSSAPPAGATTMLQFMCPPNAAVSWLANYPIVIPEGQDAWLRLARGRTEITSLWFVAAPSYGADVCVTGRR